VVLIHGTGADHRRWQRVQGELAARHTVHAVDRRGRGGSGDGPEHSIQLEAEDIAGFVEALEGPVSVVAHSFGAVCALEAAIGCSRIERLALYEPPPGAQELVVPIAARLEQLLAEGRRDEVVTTFLREVVRLGDADLAALRARPEWPSRLEAAHTLPRELLAQARHRFDPSRFAALRRPVLLLLGELSPPPMRDATMRIRDAIPSSELTLLAGESHNAMDRAPERFVAALLPFLRGAGP
jgi:pimeloyl-ACP methyl ester carboxylesterase